MCVCAHHVQKMRLNIILLSSGNVIPKTLAELWRAEMLASIPEQITNTNKLYRFYTYETTSDKGVSHCFWENNTILLCG